ncbi:MAG: TrkA C-terminal domain-containing protein, partial [Verrucomicrobiota bacterium]
RPGTQEVIDLFDGRVQAIGLRIHTDSPLLYQPLKDFPEPEMIKTLRFIAVMRGEELIIPSGETQFLIGDEVYFIGQPNDLNTFIDWADPEHLDFQKVVITGGGDVGFQLAEMLEKTHVNVILVEKDSETAEDCSKRLNKTLVIKGDALEHDTLENTGLNGHSAFVAATGNDENNIMSCLVAEKFGASFTLARINRPEYAPIINTSSLLDRAVSPHVSMINSILRFVRGRNVRSASLLQNLPGELLEVNLPDDSKWMRKKIRDIKMPHDEIVASILRKETVHIATGDFAFEPGDRLVLFSKPGAFKKLSSLFRR